MVVCVFAKIRQKKIINILRSNLKIGNFCAKKIGKIQVGYFASDYFFSSFFI